MKIFFDSWGGPWTQCPADHPQAKAFGPTGTAYALDRPQQRFVPESDLTTDEQGLVWTEVGDCDACSSYQGSCPLGHGPCYHPGAGAPASCGAPDSNERALQEGGSTGCAYTRPPGRCRCDE